MILLLGVLLLSSIPLGSGQEAPSSSEAPSAIVGSQTANARDQQLWCVTGNPYNRIYSVFEVYLWGGDDEEYTVLLDGVSIAQGNYSTFTMIHARSTIKEGHLVVVNAGRETDCGMVKFQGQGLASPDEDDLLGDIIPFLPSELATLKFRTLVSAGGLSLLGVISGGAYARANKRRTMMEGLDVIFPRS